MLRTPAVLPDEMAKRLDLLLAIPFHAIVTTNFNGPRHVAARQPMKPAMLQAKCVILCIPRVMRVIRIMPVMPAIRAILIII